MPRFPPPSQPARQQGAAMLLLLAVVGVGAGAVLVSALGGARLDTARERQTLTALALSKEALLGFALTHGRLPRPAISPNDGHERPTACATEQECTGLIPWVTLGIEGADSWGKRLRYSVTPAFATGPVRAGQTPADKRVLGRDAQGKLYDLVGQASCSPRQPCSPAVLLSSGRKNLGTSVAGIDLANGAAANADEQHNNSASNDFISRPATQDASQAGGEFDDLVSWIPLRQLYVRMSNAGQLL